MFRYAMPAWLTGLFLLAGCLSHGVAWGEPPQNATAAPAAERIHARIWLAADPMICSRQGIARLNERPKLFSAAFTAPMDRASAERAIQTNLNWAAGRSQDASGLTTASLGVVFAWRDDQALELRIERPRGTLTLSFDGARGRDGREYEALDKEFISFTTLRPQLLKRLAFDGRELGAWPVEHEILDFSHVYQGRFALAWRGFADEDGSTDIPCLVDIARGRLVKRLIPGHADGIWSLFAREEWNPATQSLLIAGHKRLTAHSLESIRAGRPGQVLFKLKEDDSRSLVGMRLAPGGARIALLCGQLQTPDQFAPGKPFYLTLYLLDPAGQVLLERRLPIEGRQFEYGCTPVALEWLDSGRLLVEAYEKGNEQPGLFLYELKADRTRLLVEGACDLRKIGSWLMFRTPKYNVWHLAEAPAAGQATLGRMLMERELNDLGPVLPVGRDRLVIEERTYSGHPRLSLLDTARGELKPFVEGRLAGADATSVWVTVSEPGQAGP